MNSDITDIKTGILIATPIPAASGHQRYVRFRCPYCNADCGEAAPGVIVECANAECRHDIKVPPLAPVLLSVQRIEIKKGFKFIGTFNDGDFVIRECATRPYTFAAVHSKHACSKFEETDRRAFITLHNSTPRRMRAGWDELVAVVTIA